MINTCWRFFKLAALLVTVAVLGMGIYLFTQMDDEIRIHVQKTLSEYFPQLNVSVGGARLIDGRGVAIYDLTISETTSTQLQNNLLVAEEIMLVCDAQFSQLINGVPPITRIEVKHPQLWVSRRTDGRWSLESLLPLPPCSDSRPQIEIRDAQISLDDQRHPQLPPLLFRDVNLSIESTNEALRQTATSRHTAENTSAEVREVESIAQPLDIQGTWRGQNVKQAKLRALCDPKNGSLHLTASFEQAQITPDILRWIAAYSAKQGRPLNIQGQIDGNVAIEHQFGSSQSPRFQARLHLRDGRLTDARLPRVLTEIDCRMQCDNGGAKIEELRGSLGTAKVAMQLERRGWQSTAPVAMGLRFENMALDEALYGCLPPLLKQQWDKYQPMGIADGELQLVFDSGNWRPSATLTGRELSFESDKFSYRVSNGSGTLRFEPSKNDKPAILDIDLTAIGGGQPLQIVGQVLDPSPKAAGWIEINGKNVHIEQSMIAAMPEKTQEVIQSLHPEGHFNFYWRGERSRAGQEKLHTQLKIELADCRIKYDKFPYPLGGIHGLILAEDKHWTFRDLTSGGSRSVQCAGHLHPSEAGSELKLHFTGQQIPLDDDLLQALPEYVRKAWQVLHPRGRIDLVADVSHQSGYAKPSIRVSVSPRPESSTIEPRFFPYPLERIEGKFDFQDGQLLMSNVRAQNGRTTVRTNGRGYFGHDSPWQVQLEGFNVDRLEASHNLLVALPPKLRRLVDRLKPTGNFGIHNGMLKFAQAGEVEATIDSQWDVHLDCHRSDLQAGVDLRNVHGTVRLVGENREGRCYSSGELDVDSATFLDVQLTDIKGPLWVDEKSCRLGRFASEQQGETARRLTARVYDGFVVGDGWATFEGLPMYGVEASLAGADLKRLMTERLSGQREFKGKVSANVSLRGRGRSLDNLEGSGDVKVTEANIYELPLLVSLLKVLRNSKPDTTAFNQSDMKFRIQGRHIYLDQLDFLGDAVSLFGRGYTNFDHQLYLVFHGVVGRNDFRIPFVKNFVGQASQQIMQMYVDGTLSNPQVHTQPFPGINSLIKQIQDDLDATGAAIRPREASRTFPAIPLWGR